MYVKLDDKYAIRGDEMNYILVRKAVNKKSGAIGEHEITEGYFSKLDSLIKFYVNAGARRKDHKSLKDLVDYIVDTENDLKEFFATKKDSVRLVVEDLPKEEEVYEEIEDGDMW